MKKYTFEEIKKIIVDFEIKVQDNLEKVFCPVHLSLGHEDVAAELHCNLIDDDWLFSTHRNHHHYLAKGGDPQKLWDEIMGLPTGINQGYAGSQAIVDKSINFHASAILGGLIGVAAGAAYAFKAKSFNQISICCIGDAGTEQGVFWETLNFSSLNSIPILFICENNGMSVDAKIEERQHGEISKKVEAFGINIFSSITESVNFVRTQRKPAFCEQKVTLRCSHINMATMLD